MNQEKSLIVSKKSNFESKIYKLFEPFYFDCIHMKIFSFEFMSKNFFDDFLDSLMIYMLYFALFIPSFSFKIIEVTLPFELWNVVFDFNIWIDLRESIWIFLFNFYILPEIPREFIFNVIFHIVDTNWTMKLWINIIFIFCI